MGAHRASTPTRATLAIKAILRSKLAVLRTCGGRNCRVNVGRLPEPR